MCILHFMKDNDLVLPLEPARVLLGQLPSRLVDPSCQRIDCRSSCHHWLYMLVVLLVLDFALCSADLVLWTALERIQQYQRWVAFATQLALDLGHRLPERWVHSHCLLDPKVFGDHLGQQSPVSSLLQHRIPAFQQEGPVDLGK